jgi:phage FluMu protein Com
MSEENRKVGKCSNCNRLIYDVNANDDTLPDTIECQHCHTVNQVRVPYVAEPKPVKKSKGKK